MNANLANLKKTIGRLTLWQGVLLAVLAAGLYATVLRFAQGLGAATNLSDEFPWGLWIGFDVLVGVGLAAGGFVVAATVHVFRIERYESIARPAVLTAFLGYILVIVGLLFDLGLPYRIWHPLVMWNPHSVMFEVAWCVTLYTTVLALEFLPLVLERFRLAKPLKVLRAIYVPLVIVGVLLSTLHQSSLGSLYVIVPDKLYGLWYTPLLPVFFFLSAVAGGLAMTIFESFMSYRAFGKRLEHHLLAGIARVLVVVLAVYALIKFQDLAGRGSLHLVWTLTPESVLFWGEIGLGVLLPMVLFALPQVRASERGLFFGALLTVMGFIVNRLNVAVTGMTASSGVTYIPSWMEFAVTASIVGAGLLLFALAVKYLPIFPKEEMPPAGVDPVLLRRRPALSRGVLAALWVLMIIGIVGVAVSSPRHSEAPPAKAAVEPVAPAVEPSELRLPHPYTFPASGDSPGPVVFDHEVHAMAVDNQCRTCHASLFRLTEPGKPVSGKLTYEAIHEGPLCASCHNGQKAFAIDEDCANCHQQ
ncbi:MAG TPA: Ni/Fe-hydrogenase cytochrome b subunit [Thermoanaerobaculia bacterium]|nr:Ni/Fe-hydrogenase cytochrome b subunit [Thermoanaerobaculia bacterium]